MGDSHSRKPVLIGRGNVTDKNLIAFRLQDILLKKHGPLKQAPLQSCAAFNPDPYYSSLTDSFSVGSTSWPLQKTPNSSSALSAAFCSAIFLFGPQALGNLRPSSDTHTSKHLLWSGPFSSSNSYIGANPISFCACC